MTVEDLLKDLDDSYPYDVVRINNRHIPRHKFAHAEIPDKSEVYLIPMIVGG